MNPQPELPLPLEPGQITAQWLGAALGQRRPGVEVIQCEVGEILPGTSTKIRVSVRYAPGPSAQGLPSQLIVKGGFEAHSPAMKGMYEKEIRFYRDVQPWLDMHTPASFYADSDPDSHQSIVIMEDLKARGVEFCHPLRPQSYAQLARRLEAMARYHAQTWDSVEFKPGGRLQQVEPYLGAAFTREYQARYFEPDTWAHYMCLPRAAAVPRRLRDREWMMAAQQQLAAMEQNGPQCLMHGDTHLGNLYIEADGTPGFFDMQIGRAPWYHEFSYHLIAALDIEDRRHWDQPLLAHYLSALRAQGVAVPGFDEAWEQHRRSVVWGLWVFLINETRFQTEAVNTACAARFGAAALDYGTRGLF